MRFLSPVAHSLSACIIAASLLTQPAQAGFVSKMFKRGMVAGGTAVALSAGQAAAAKQESTSVQSAMAIAGRVVGVLDGDTITVLDAGKQQHRIRLAFIDAPEKSQPFGNASKRSLSALTIGQEVKVHIFGTDNYGRSIGKVSVNGLDVNLEMIRRGMAWHYTKYADEQAQNDRQAYAEAFYNAQSAARGLWAEPRPAPPWEYRHPPKTAKPGF